MNSLLINRMIHEDQRQKVIWTIGHSTHTADEFLVILQSFQIERLADIRRFPGSRRYPHFNKAPLEELLSGNGIKYTSFTELGGRRRAKPDSVNTAWRNAAFKGYADYMETDELKESVEKSTLGDLGVLAQLKEQMEGAESKAKKEADKKSEEEK